MNPADLFTKHLSSRDRIDQLVKLFNCEFREGRAGSAPLLRRQKTIAHGGTAAIATQVDDLRPHDNHEFDMTMTKQQLQPHTGNGGKIEVFEEIEQQPHDPTYLPHEFPDDEIEMLFPMAAAPAVIDGDVAASCICSRPECTRCFPKEPPLYSAGLEAW